MLDNLAKGYGPLVDSTQNGSKDNDPTKSKVLEELKNKGVLKEDIFPKTPVEAPIPSKELEALNERDKLKEKEETFSGNTEENLILKNITYNKTKYYI
jgi:hypothetical protein